MGDTAAARAMRALRTHAPDLAGLPLRALGHGLHNVAHVAGDLVLRVAEGPDVLREAALLTLLAPRVPLPVPTPRFADADAGVLAYPLLPGRPLVGRAAPPGLARRLGRFLRSLHAVPAADVADLVPVEDQDYDEWLTELDGPAELVDAVRSAVPPVAGGERTLCHGDLGAEHVLERDGAVTGVIDWTDAAVTDPALDFARLHRDFGPGFLAEVLDTYGGLPGAGRRIEFFARCTALEDLTYGATTGRDEYAAAARRSFAWLFPGVPLTGQP